MFIIRDQKILLIDKKRGHGAGKVNGPGGKIDPGESPLQAAVRETIEELHVTPLAPVKIGELMFHMSDMPGIHCHVFRATDFTGTPTETDEAVPRWTQLAEIPFDLMWQDDIHWFPHLLDGSPFLGRFIFSGESLAWHAIDRVAPWKLGS